MFPIVAAGFPLLYLFQCTLFWALDRCSGFSNKNNYVNEVYIYIYIGKGTTKWREVNISNTKPKKKL